MNIIALIEALISSVPEAVQLWDKIAPMIDVKAGLSDAAVAEVNALAPAATDAVSTARDAVKALVATHT